MAEMVELKELYVKPKIEQILIKLDPPLCVVVISAAACVVNYIGFNHNLAKVELPRQTVHKCLH